MAAPSAVYPPEVWAVESLMVLQNTHVAANLVYRNFENEVAASGDIVRTRKPTLGTVQSLTNGAAITIASLDATEVTITLDQHRYTAFRVTDREMSTSLKNLVQEFVEPFVIPIAKQVDDDLLGTSCLTHSSIARTQAGTTGGPIDFGDFASARGTLRSQQVPVIQPQFVHAVLGTDHETEALKIEEFIQADTYGKNPPAIATGFLGTIYGMSIFADQGVPQESTANQQSCFFHRMAAALVTRPLDLPPQSDVIRAAVAQKDGVGIRAVMSYDHDYLAWKVSYDLLYGFALLDANLATVLEDQ